jgi:hypothetical protein
MSEWQPIETAPMDGTLILLWPYIDFGAPGEKDFSYVAAGFFSDEWENWYDLNSQELFNPTHWMTLPVPPAEKTP